MERADVIMTEQKTMALYANNPHKITSTGRHEGSCDCHTESTQCEKHGINHITKPTHRQHYDSLESHVIL